MNHEGPSAAEAAELLASELAAAAQAPTAPPDLPAVDLRTLLGEMAALKGEVRQHTLAARGGREAVDEGLSELQRRLAGVTRQLASRGDGAADGRRLAAMVLIDVIDRLEPTLQAASRAGQGSWFARWRRPDPSLAAVAEGLRLTLDHLQQRLAELGVRRVATAGQPFDATTMHAVQVVSEPDEAPGAVVRELAAGYRDRAGVLRPARGAVQGSGGAPRLTEE